MLIDRHDAAQEANLLGLHHANPSYVYKEKKQSQKGVQVASRMAPLFRGAQVLCDSLM